VADCQDFTHVGITSLATSAASLQHINFSWCDGATDESIRLLMERSQSLHSVTLNVCEHVTDDTIKCLQQHPLLTRLEISRCIHIGGDTVCELSKYWHRYIHFQYLFALNIIAIFFVLSCVSSID
jgi:hypothetical protein